MSTPTIEPLATLPSELKVVLKEGTERCANLTSRFGVESSALADLRMAIVNKDVKNDATILDDFCRLVPLTQYESYLPFITKLMERPCKLSEVENLLAPGLPNFLCSSSTTSGNKPKYIPKYTQFSQDPSVADLSAGAGTTAVVYSVNSRGLLEVVSDSGEVVHTIPLTVSSAVRWRTTMNWTIETDESRMMSIVPGHVAPWATGLITHHRSFLLIHALFMLANRHVEKTHTLYVTVFMDIVNCIQQDWEILLSSIRDGSIPDIDHIDHVRAQMQAHMHADPQRAEELRHIGPPLSCSGWAQHTWPMLKTLASICSGAFSGSLPKARIVLGPNITIHNHAYGCTEGLVCKALNFGDTGAYIVDTEDVVEFLDVADMQLPCNIVQGWGVQAGRLYQPVYTSRNGLWRYLIDDIIEVIGFHPHKGLPVFKYSARKSPGMRLYCFTLTEADLANVIQAINIKDIIEVQEFTVVHDQRKCPETVGFFVEIVGDDVGPNAPLARQKAFGALVEMNFAVQAHFDAGRVRQPTIRIVKPGTFTEYRRWKVETQGIDISQVKIPVVMRDQEALE
ncbi:GH3 auxin-responsive promoter [Scleroderma yunnanense]